MISIQSRGYTNFTFVFSLKQHWLVLCLVKIGLYSIPPSLCIETVDIWHCLNVLPNLCQFVLKRRNVHVSLIAGNVILFWSLNNWNKAMLWKQFFGISYFTSLPLKILINFQFAKYCFSEHTSISPASKSILKPYDGNDISFWYCRFSLYIV